MRAANRCRKRKPSEGFSLLELLMVLAIVSVIAAMAIPKVMTIVQNARTVGDIQSLNSAILLAKMRGASDFARARVYMDLSANTYRVDIYPSGATSWTTDGATTAVPHPVNYLAKNVSFGYGSLTTAPSGMSSLAQAPACLADDLSTTVTNTACIMFNSRGIPVDSTWAATGVDAIYVTDGKSVAGVTVSASGLTKIWRTPASTAAWLQR